MIREVHVAPGMEFPVEYTDQAHGYHAFVVIRRRAMLMECGALPRFVAGETDPAP